MINSDLEVKNFWDNVYPDLIEDEVGFVSLSARKKYLHLDEREFYGLKRTEMFQRRIFRNFREFYSILQQYEACLDAGAYHTNTGKDDDFPERAIPNKCVVCYVNINPTSMKKASTEFAKDIIDFSGGSDLTQYKYVLSKYHNRIQTSRSRKIWIDVDFDTERWEIVSEFLTYLNDNKVSYQVVHTKSGFHVLLLRETIHVNFYEKVQELNSKVAPDGEVVVNSNGMVPVPGTLQAGAAVSLVEGFSY